LNLFEDANLEGMEACTMKPVRESEFPVQIQNNTADEVLFAVIYSPKISAKLARDAKNKSLERWESRPGELTHRRLLNDQTYSKYSDLALNLGAASNAELLTYKAIAEIRFPGLLNIDESLVKKKKEKNMAHGIADRVRFNDNIFTPELFQYALDYMYTGKLDFLELDDEKVIRIYAMAKQLRYDALGKYCRAHLESNLGLHNVFLTLKFTSEQKQDDLKDFAINFCLNNWQTISASKEGLGIIGLSLFQEITVAKAGNPETPPLLTPTEFPPNTLIEDFQRIRSLMHFADAVSVFGNVIVPYHRCILAAASPKFHTVFAKEAGSSKKTLPRYSFDTISGGAFKGLIDLIYSGTTNISLNEACELLENMAVQFELETVRQDCEAIICQPQKIDDGNVMNVLRVTYLKFNEGRANLTVVVRGHCLAYICAHFRDVDMSLLKKFDASTAWEILQMLHERFNKHSLVGLD
jgi:hypothetical protein